MLTLDTGDIRTLGTGDTGRQREEDGYKAVEVIWLMLAFYAILIWEIALNISRCCSRFV